MAIEKLMNLREFGELVGWKKSRVHRAVATGEVPAILLSKGERRRSWRIRPSDAERWIKSREVKNA